MRVLVIGSGGREHALCWALRRSPRLSQLYCAPGNGGTAEIAENIMLDPMDFSACATWAERHAIDLTIVGPDAPLGHGITDVFAARGLLVFGPNRAAAQIESSKRWATERMLRAGVPTAPFEHFTEGAAAAAWIAQREKEGSPFPVVVKADGLMAGKGVVVAQNADEARQAVATLLAPGVRSSILIEQYLTGLEVSIFALCDGERVKLLAPACDYKRAMDGDKGPNTGGMGAYSPPGFVTPEMLSDIEARILRPTVRIMAEGGTPFRGLLYAGIMLTDSGPYVLEFNARFGDPETQVILPRLHGDVLCLCHAVALGNLNNAEGFTWAPEAACGVVITSAGYPGPYETGKTIKGLEKLDENILVFHAGTRREYDGRLVTSGGRVLSLVALGNTIAEARAQVYANIGRVQFEQCHYRTDIAERETTMSL